MQNAEFRSHGKLARRRIANVTQHPSGRKEEGALLRQRAVGGFRHARTHASALGMQEKLGVGMLFEDFDDMLGPDDFVHVAVTLTWDDIAALRLPRHHVS